MGEITLCAKKKNKQYAKDIKLVTTIKINFLPVSERVGPPSRRGPAARTVPCPTCRCARAP